MRRTPPFEPDPDQPGYLYLAFADYIATLIDQRVLNPGERLPNEEHLAKQHGISIGTVRRATQELRDRGRVVTYPAKGTYVANPQPGDDAQGTVGS